VIELVPTPLGPLHRLQAKQHCNEIERMTIKPHDGTIIQKVGCVRIDSSELRNGSLSGLRDMRYAVTASTGKEVCVAVMTQQRIKTHTD